MPDALRRRQKQMYRCPENTFEPTFVWDLGSPAPPLGTCEAQFWLGPLDVPVLALPSLAELLPDDERDRAGRFHFAADRHRYIVSHAMLRLILGAYLEQSPRLIRFSTNAFGKPFVEAVTNSGQIEFSLSHSGDMAAIGIVRGHPVGVDVELVRNEVNIEELAPTIFTAGELASLRTFEGAAREEAFFNGWTRKEAYIKARGAGLSYPLQEFDVSIDSSRTFQVKDQHAQGTTYTGWATRTTHRAMVYPAAMIVLGEGMLVRHFSWRKP
ncbi:MAG: 4'-phosphopantetheinyl transferase superfamily protein [Pedosphaera sp.]|nr:4'-phosphopantetheinyl transferase superfamily protein [Pedosphaera sp.]